MRWTRIVPAFFILVVLAACGETGGDPLGPSGARMNGGLVVGGNRTESDSTATGTQSQTTSTDTVPTSPSEEGYNGGLVVGGN
jgi:hypothetical protein